MNNVNSDASNSNKYTTSLSATDEQRIVSRIAHDGEYDIQTAERIFVGVVTFLRMIGHNRAAPSTPSAMIDAGWHAFLLYTALYRKFCLAECGRFIDHTPNDDPHRRTLIRPMHETVHYMQTHDVPFDAALWQPNIGTCDETCAAYECDDNCD